MKKIFYLILLIVCGSNAYASPEVAIVRKAIGVMPNPELAPLGQLVNTKNGEVLYVNSVISVLTPDQLDDNCIYKVQFIRDQKIKSRVKLLPPMVRVSCGHDFPAGR